MTDHRSRSSQDSALFVLEVVDHGRQHVPDHYRPSATTQGRLSLYASERGVTAWEYQGEFEDYQHTVITRNQGLCLALDVARDLSEAHAEASNGENLPFRDYLAMLPVETAEGLDGLLGSLSAYVLAEGTALGARDELREAKLQAETLVGLTTDQETSLATDLLTLEAAADQAKRTSTSEDLQALNKRYHLKEMLRAGKQQVVELAQQQSNAETLARIGASAARVRKEVDSLGASV